MKIFEVTDDKLEHIRDYLVYLNMKNIDKVSTESVLEEIKKLGIVTDFEEIVPIISDLDFIDDVNQDYITFQNDGSKKVGSSSGDLDLDQNTVSTMAKRARRRRD